MHRLATIHNVTDDDDDRRNSVAIARPLVWSAKNDEHEKSDKQSRYPLRKSGGQ